MFEKLKKELGIGKGVELLCDAGTGAAFTIGVFRRYVIMPEQGLTDEEFYYILKHEMIHVRRRDVGWRYLGLFVLLLHWFNPFIYLYVFVMTIFSEQSCDEMAIQDLSNAKRLQYGNLMLDMASENKTRKFRYGTYFNMGKKIIEWRVKNMVRVGNKKRVKRVTGLLLGAAILFGGSLTVCAYEDTRVIEDVDQSFMEASIDKQSQWDFVKDDDLQAAADEVLDFVEFVADDGTCYDLSEMQNGGMERAGCIHEYESGYLKNHEKNSDGSCVTTYYKADMCHKCGRVIMKGYSHTESWAQCPH